MALEPSEQRRVVRHLRSYWDARRFRVAPQVQAVLKRRRREGTFRSMAGVVRAVRPSTTGLPIVIRSRGAETNSYCEFDRIVVATGPAHSEISSAQPYLARLEADGLVALDRLGLGLAVDLRGRAVGRLGQTIETLLVGGPLARGCTRCYKKLNAAGKLIQRTTSPPFGRPSVRANDKSLDRTHPLESPSALAIMHSSRISGHIGVYRYSSWSRIQIGDTSPVRALHGQWKQPVPKGVLCAHWAGDSAG